MANAAKDYGLTPVSSMAGALPATIQCVGLSGVTSALYVGDPVILAGAGDQQGRPSVDIAIGSEGTESEFVFGVITGVRASDPDSLATLGGTASTNRILTVMPALSNIIWRINASNTTGANPNDIGGGFDLVLTAGDALTGRSKWALDMGDDNQAIGAAGQVRLIGFDNRPDNAIGAAGTDTADIDCLIVFAESYWNSGADGGLT